MNSCTTCPEPDTRLWYYAFAPHKNQAWLYFPYSCHLIPFPSPSISTPRFYIIHIDGITPKTHKRGALGVRFDTCRLLLCSPVDDNTLLADLGISTLGRVRLILIKGLVDLVRPGHNLVGHSLDSAVGECLHASREGGLLVSTSAFGRFFSFFLLRCLSLALFDFLPTFLFRCEIFEGMAQFLT